MHFNKSGISNQLIKLLILVFVLIFLYAHFAIHGRVYDVSDNENMMLSNITDNSNLLLSKFI